MKNKTKISHTLCVLGRKIAKNTFASLCAALLVGVIAYATGTVTRFPDGSKNNLLTTDNWNALVDKVNGLASASAPSGGGLALGATLPSHALSCTVSVWGQLEDGSYGMKQETQSVTLYPNAPVINSGKFAIMYRDQSSSFDVKAFYFGGSEWSTCVPYNS